MFEITSLNNYENYINEILQNLSTIFAYFIFIMGLIIIVIFSLFLENKYFLIVGYAISILGFILGICNLFLNAF